jgi:hypothetical protein
MLAAVRLSLAVAAVLAAAHPARAQVACAGAACFIPVQILPPDGATAVPTNVVFQVFSATGDARPFTLEGPGAPELPELEVEPFRTGSLQAFRVRPVSALQPATRYTFSTSAPDFGGTGRVSFVTGAGPDHAAPAFAGIRAIAWEQQQNPCGARALFRLDLGAATDEVAGAHVTVYAYTAKTAGKQDFRTPEAVLAFAGAIELGAGACAITADVSEGVRHFIVLGAVDWAGNETRSEEWYADAVPEAGCGCGGAGASGGALFALAAFLVPRRRRHGATPQRE